MENIPNSINNSLTKVLGDTSLKVNNCIIHPYTDDTYACSSCKRKEKTVCSKCSDDQIDMSEKGVIKPCDGILCN